MEHLDGSVADSDVEHLFDELKRGGVEALGDLDMVVGAKAAAHPSGEGERLGWQYFERRGVDLCEELGTTGAPRTGEFRQTDIRHLSDCGQLLAAPSGCVLARHLKSL